MTDDKLEITPEQLKIALSEFIKKSAKPENLIDRSKERLIEFYKSYYNNHDFSPGDIVKWKPGLKNRKFPEYGMPGIVIDVLDISIVDKQNDAGSPYFRESLDIVIAIIDASGDFISYHYDSGRFEPVED